jgi:glutathione S-transferase
VTTARLTLYTTARSANGRKPLAVARHLGLSHELRSIDVYAGEGRSAEYLAINPSGQIPTLVDGDLVLFESNAILQYLAEAHGDFALSSRDPKERASISRWLFWEASAWQPALTSILTLAVAQAIRLVPAMPPAIVDWAEPGFVRVASLLDAHLCGRSFIVADRLTLADFSIAGMMTYARSAGFPFETFVNVGAWYGRVERLEAWQATLARPWT